MKNQLKHIWYYYKWYIIAGAVLILLLLDFAVQKKAQPEPDMQIAVVTARDFDQASQDALSAGLSLLIPDANGDGKVIFAVNYYPYNAETDDTSDPALFMAGAVQLAADIKYKSSCVYLTDCPKLLIEADPELVAVGNAGDYAILDQYPALAGLDVLSRGSESRLFLKP